MAEPGDIWQRYDAKVMQILQMESRLAAIERELGQTRDERDHWAHVCRDLGKKLSVARTLAERLRTAERAKSGRPETTRFRRPSELQSSVQQSGGTGQIKDEYDRAREVLGLVLTALSKALDDEAAAELGRKLRHHAGGKLLHSITRGSLTLVPVDGRYLVDRTWLEQLDLAGLRRELDVAAQSGVYTMADESMTHGSMLDVDVDIEDEEEDGNALPPPPPLPAADFRTLPPLLSALPDESDVAMARSTPPDSTKDNKGTAPMRAAPLIPNLISRLVKTPGTT